MIFTYEPEGEAKRAWVYDAGKLMSPECEAIERVTKLTYMEFQQELAKGHTRARRALLWVLLKREHPTLRFDDVSFKYSEIDIEFSTQDLDRMEDQVKENLAEEDLDDALRAIETMRKTAYTEEEGKAVPPNDGSAT